jgi:hypothetical protein
VTVALVIGGVILLAMIGVSWYGAVTLPGDARVPIHFGVSDNNFVPKRAGLVMHPAAGAVVLLLLAFASHGNSGQWRLVQGATARPPCDHHVRTARRPGRCHKGGTPQVRRLIQISRTGSRRPH